MTIDHHPHRRRNALTGEWVLVSPQRTRRPWQGKIETLLHADLPVYDPQCYLCPGNTRAGGETNPRYTSTFGFPAPALHSRTSDPSAQRIGSASDNGPGRPGSIHKPAPPAERQRRSPSLSSFAPHTTVSLRSSIEEVRMVVMPGPQRQQCTGTGSRWYRSGNKGG
jgi:UDPglucose--hexose-1-phosphate uridylyltransferase